MDRPNRSKKDLSLTSLVLRNSKSLYLILLLNCPLKNSGIRNMQQQGLFDRGDAHRTLALKVEDRIFWVCRGTLASFSPVFKAMLYGPFAEGKNKDVAIPLPGKRAADIEQLLLFLHPSLVGGGRKQEITKANLEPMLALADEYEIDTIKSIAELYLMKKMVDTNRSGAPPSETELMSMLRIASEYRLKIDEIKSYAEKFLINKMENAQQWRNDDATAELLSMLRIGSRYRLKCLLFKCIKRCCENTNMSMEKFRTIIPELSSEVVAGFMLYRDKIGDGFGYTSCSNDKVVAENELFRMLDRIGGDE